MPAAMGRFAAAAIAALLPALVAAPPASADDDFATIEPIWGSLNADAYRDWIKLGTGDGTRCNVRVHMGAPASKPKPTFTRYYTPPAQPGQAKAGCADRGVLADVTGDGKTDVVLGFSTKPGLLILDANITVKHVVHTMAAANWLTAAELNGDGRADIVSVDVTKRMLTTHFGNSTTLRRGYVIQNVNSASDVTVASLNSHKGLDLLVADASNVAPGQELRSRASGFRIVDGPTGQVTVVAVPDPDFVVGKTKAAVRYSANDAKPELAEIIYENRTKRFARPDRVLTVTYIRDSQWRWYPKPLS